MLAMPQNDASKSKSPVESDASVEPSAPKAPAPKAAKGVDIKFDSSFPVDPAVTSVNVSVAAAAVELKTDGTPVNVTKKDAALLLQSPAVTEAK
jgi:hypothetical protein